MDGGLLSLKWNNHRSTLFYMLSTVRKKECYTDVTLACDGKFYSVHKLVLSMCSEYFEQMFEQTQCKHPVIVLKDIKSEELESLLSYMYVGEVNVVQEKLSGLIKAAECLKIKGLAVPDEEPCSKPSTNREKRSSDNSLNSEPKRRRQDDSGNTSSFRQGHSNNRNDDRRKSLDHPSSSTSNKFRNTNSSNSNVNSNRASSGDKESGDRGSSRAERVASPEVKTEEQADAAETEPVEEVMIDEPPQPVKEEPTDADAVYLSDSNSVPDHKDDILMDNFADAGQQQHFMDELLGQTSESNQGNMGAGDYSEGGEGSSGAGGQQQQHMVSRQLPAVVDSRPFPSSSSTHQPTSSSGDIPASANQLQDSASRSLQSELVDPRFILGSGSSINSPLAEIRTFVHGDAAGRTHTPEGSHASSGPPLPSGMVPFDELPRTQPKRPNMKYACPVCLKEFYDKNHFRHHYMIHTGEKPHACPYCPYRARQGGCLTAHIMSRHR